MFSFILNVVSGKAKQPAIAYQGTMCPQNAETGTNNFKILMSAEAYFTPFNKILIWIWRFSKKCAVLGWFEDL